MRVKCLAQEHNAVPPPGLETEPFDLESSKLTNMPLCLPQNEVLFNSHYNTGKDLSS